MQIYSDNTKTKMWLVHYEIRRIYSRNACFF